MGASGFTSHPKGRKMCCGFSSPLKIHHLGKKKNLKKTKIKLYNTIALPTLLYGSENWTISARDATRITAAEMKYMRRTARHTWTDH
jgi:hypothetical protein